MRIRGSRLETRIGHHVWFVWERSRYRNMTGAVRSQATGWFEICKKSPGHREHVAPVLITTHKIHMRWKKPPVLFWFERGCAVPSALTEYGWGRFD